MDATLTQNSKIKEFIKQPSIFDSKRKSLAVEKNLVQKFAKDMYSHKNSLYMSNNYTLKTSNENSDYYSGFLASLENDNSKIQKLRKVKNKQNKLSLDISLIRNVSFSGLNSNKIKTAKNFKLIPSTSNTNVISYASSTTTNKQMYEAKTHESDNLNIFSNNIIKRNKINKNLISNSSDKEVVIENIDLTNPEIADEFQESITNTVNLNTNIENKKKSNINLKMLSSVKEISKLTTIREKKSQKNSQRSLINLEAKSKAVSNNQNIFSFLDKTEQPVKSINKEKLPSLEKIDKNNELSKLEKENKVYKKICTSALVKLSRKLTQGETIRRSSSEKIEKQYCITENNSKVEDNVYIPKSANVQKLTNNINNQLPPIDRSKKKKFRIFSCC